MVQDVKEKLNIEVTVPFKMCEKCQWLEINEKTHTISYGKGHVTRKTKYNCKHFYFCKEIIGMHEQNKPKAKKINYKKNGKTVTFLCSECNECIDDLANYCEHCGRLFEEEIITEEHNDEV